MGCKIWLILCWVDESIFCECIEPNAGYTRLACLTFPLSGIYVFHPTIPGYPKARFPGVVVFSEIYQGEYWN